MIDKLEMFIALAREKHFGRAAEDRGVTQPTLSAAIKQLEEQLGVQLVWRGSRYQSLTPEGQRVLQWARQIVADTRTMREEMRAARQGLSGNLRIAAIPTALAMLAQLTTPYRAHHPGVRFSIASRTSQEILTMLDNLEIDAGITYLGNEPLGRVTSVPLFRERYVYVCRASDPEAGLDAIGWARAATLPLALLTPDMQNRRIINQTFAAVGASVQPEIEATSVLVLVSHVLESGLGAILPIKAADLFLDGGRLAAVPLTDPDASQSVGLIAPFREPHTPVLEALLREARALSEVPDGPDPLSSL